MFLYAWVPFCHLLNDPWLKGQGSLCYWLKTLCSVTLSHTICSKQTNKKLWCLRIRKATKVQGLGWLDKNVVCYFESGISLTKFVAIGGGTKESSSWCPRPALAPSPKSGGSPGEHSFTEPQHERAILTPTNRANCSGSTESSFLVWHSYSILPVALSLMSLSLAFTNCKMGCVAGRSVWRSVAKMVKVHEKTSTRLQLNVFLLFYSIFSLVQLLPFSFTSRINSGINMNLG